METDKLDGALIRTLAIDYITLTTEDKDRVWGTYLALMEGNEHKKSIPTGRVKYRGTNCDGIFFGIARMDEGERYMLSVPGLRAHPIAMSEELAYPTAECSRFDLQVSLPEHELPPIRKFGERLLSAAQSDWRQPGGAPIVRMIQGSDGLDTVYVGKRNSQIYRRFYIKETSLGRVFRGEIEFKGAMARGAHREGRTSDYGELGAMYVRALWGLPDYVGAWTGPLMGCINEPTGEYRRPVCEPDAETRWRWWSSVVAPAAKKALARGEWAQIQASLRAKGIDIRVT